MWRRADVRLGDRTDNISDERHFGASVSQNQSGGMVGGAAHSRYPAIPGTATKRPRPTPETAVPGVGFGMAAPDPSTYFRKGFGLRAEVQDELASDYSGRLVDRMRA